MEHPGGQAHVISNNYSLSKGESPSLKAKNTASLQKRELMICGGIFKMLGGGEVFLQNRSSESPSGGKWVLLLGLSLCFVF